MVGVGQGIGEEHDAAGILAVGEAQEVAQFVNRLLQGAFLKQGEIARLAIELWVQAGQGNNGQVVAGFGQAEDEIKLGDKEVNGGNSQHQVLGFLAPGGQPGQKSFGLVLPALRNIS